MHTTYSILMEEGVNYLAVYRSGKGKVVIFGAGNVGLRAAKLAIGLGADVTLMDTNIRRMRSRNLLPKVKQYIHKAMLLKYQCRFSNQCSKWYPGLRIISRDMLKYMKANSLIVDIDAEPGGAIETSKYTSHEDPVYVVDGIRHICIPSN